MNISWWQTNTWAHFHMLSQSVKGSFVQKRILDVSLRKKHCWQRLQALRVLLGHPAESKLPRQSLPFAHRADANNSRFEAVQGILGEHILSWLGPIGGRAAQGGKRTSQASGWPTMACNRQSSWGWNGLQWESLQASVGIEGNLNLRQSLRR